MLYANTMAFYIRDLSIHTLLLSVGGVQETTVTLICECVYTHTCPLYPLYMHTYTYIFLVNSNNSFIFLG
jgi:hypothetical protein